MAPGVRVSMILTLNLSRKNGKVEYFINLLNFNSSVASPKLKEKNI